MTATAEGQERALRAARHAALGDPVRLGIVDELSMSDRAPVELRRLLGLESNLLAHHLDVLERVALVERSRSSGDGRRRYVHLRRSALDGLTPASSVVPVGPALFVCTANSARSPLAAALWRHRTGRPAASAGTHPADRFHPGAVAAARRVGLDLEDDGPTSLGDANPQHVDAVAIRRARLDAGHGPSAPPDAGAPGDVHAERLLVVTVCDQAHEELDPDPSWLHWSVPDPVPSGTPAAFDAVVAELVERIDALAGADEVGAP